MNKKILIPLGILGLVALFFMRSCNKPVNTEQKPVISDETKEKIKDIIKKIIEKEKEITKDAIKKTITDEIKKVVAAPDPEISKTSHFVLQPGIGFVYIDKPRLSLDVHFWRHKNFGALGGVALDVTGNQQFVKGFLAGSYTFTKVPLVSVFVGTSEQALVKLDIKKAEVAVGLRIKLPL